MSWGNCFAEKVRNGYGEITQLWPITPNRVQITMEDGVLIYKIYVDNVIYKFTRDKILHIPGLGFDGFQGYSVIAMARKSIGLSMAMETFGSLYFGQGTHPGGIVTHPTTLKDPKTFREAFDEEYSSLSQSHRVMLLQEGMKFEKIGIPPEDAQFLQSRTFQIPEVARWFNLPPHKLKDQSRATNNNIESEQQSYVTDSLLPVAINIEQNLDLQLLTDIERFKQFYYFRHNFDALLRGNSVDRANYYKIMTSIGGMTINDVRDKEKFDPFPDSYADEPFIAVNNMIPLSKVDEWLKNQAKSNAAPKPSADKEAPNAIADALRTLAKDIETYGKHGFVTDYKMSYMEDMRTEEERRCQLITTRLINMRGWASIEEPPSAFFLESEDHGWRVTVGLQLQFE